MKRDNGGAITLTSSPLLSKTLLLDVPALQRILQAGPVQLALNNFMLGFSYKPAPSKLLAVLAAQCNEMIQAQSSVNTLIESQNHRMVGVGRDLCGSSSF